MLPVSSASVRLGDNVVLIIKGTRQRHTDVLYHSWGMSSSVGSMGDWSQHSKNVALVLCAGHSGAAWVSLIQTALSMASRPVSQCAVLIPTCILTHTRTHIHTQAHIDAHPVMYTCIHSRRHTITHRCIPRDSHTSAPSVGPHAHICAHLHVCKDRYTLTT